MAPQPKLTYFEGPGRAETARIMFDIGKVPYENATVAFSEGGTTASWAALKDSTPFGQLPILEVDGVTIAQSGAINRYVARLTGLYPEDPLDAAKADMADAQLADCLEPLWATFGIKDQDAAQKAREEYMAGKMDERLRALDKLVASSGGDYVLGSKLSFADVNIYSQLSGTLGGVPGIPANLLTKYPALKNLRHKVASLPAVAARYAVLDKSNPNDARRFALRPDVE